MVGLLCRIAPNDSLVAERCAARILPVLERVS
jgi:hypothetical protein